MKKIFLYTLLITLFISGCNTDLDLVNENNPDRANVLNSSDGVITIVKGSYLSTVQNILGYRAPFYDYLADQRSSCSLSRDWPFNKEPRENIPNTIGNSSVAGAVYGGSYSHWTKLYGHIANVNNVLLVIKKGLKIQDNSKKDISELTKAHALFIRGLNLGYIGVLYRRGAIMKEDTDVSKIKLVPYADVIDAAVADLEAAKVIFKKNTAYKNTYFKGGPSAGFSATEMEQIINTFVAKFLIAKARTLAQFKTLNFAQIENYLNNAYNKDLSFVADGATRYYSHYQRYAAHLYRGGKTSHVVDQKVIYLMSKVDGGTPTYKKRPKSLGTNDMPAITSKDARFNLYYEHRQLSLFYYSERDPRLYSNYRFKRYYQKDDRAYPLLLFRNEEIRLLKAELAYIKGDYTAAAGIINHADGERVKTGKLKPVAATEEAVSDALFYENCVELQDAGLAIAWTFMRRHDRLQKGTLLHLPVYDLEIQNLLAGKAFNIGGISKADGVDASKENPRSWIKLAEMN